MGVEEYPIDDAWKKKTSSSSYGEDLQDAFNALDECPIPEITDAEIKSNSVEILLEDNTKAAIFFLDGVCKKHNLKISVPDQDGWSKRVYLEPDPKSTYEVARSYLK